VRRSQAREWLKTLATPEEYQEHIADPDKFFEWFSSQIARKGSARDAEIELLRKQALKSELRKGWLISVSKYLTPLFDAEAADRLTNEARGDRNFVLWHDCIRLVSTINHMIRNDEL
jgi:hypothetical protein